MIHRMRERSGFLGLLGVRKLLQLSDCNMMVALTKSVGEYNSDEEVTKKF